MNDYIEIEKIWHDNELMQLNVVCSSMVLTASSKIYVTDALLDDLSTQIGRFVNGNVQESFWANEEKGDNSTACISFRFLRKDNLGHILIEVYMEIDDGGEYSSHNCCFYINTELGLLNSFYEKLHCLKQKVCGIKITLNDNCWEE